jgi:hypothetical protein
MADKKISALPAVTMPLAETEVLPIVQSATTKKVTVAELTTLIKHTMTMNGTNVLQFGDAGFTASINYNGDGSLRIKPRAGYPVQVDLANIKFSNAGYGIDFSANANAAGMTSELLNWYEVGTWTGTLTATTPPTVPVTATGRYTRIGNQVTIAIEFENVSTVGAVGGLEVTGLPFTAVSSGYGPAMKSGLGVQAVTAGVYGGLSKVIFSDSGTMNNTPIVAGLGVYLRFSATYFM